MLKRILARLEGPQRETSALNEAQTQALRMHILPKLEELLPKDLPTRFYLAEQSPPS